MKSKLNYKSGAFQAIHTSAAALLKVGAIDKATMRSFDLSCLSLPQTLTADEIKKLREQCQVSQPVFARYLNTSESTIEKWESGARQPNGMALRLLSVVRKHGLNALL